MLQHKEPMDFVIATGRTVSLEYFVQRAFAHFDLDWRRHVIQDRDLLRPSDVRYGSANPARAEECLAWRAKLSVDDVITEMCRAAHASTHRQ